MKSTKHLLLAVLFLITAQGFAQSRVPVWLNLSAGGNVADCYDNGTVPFSYYGVGGNLSLGATVEWHRCHVQHETRLYGNMLENGGSSIDIDSRTEFLYRFHDNQRNHLHLWAGVALQGYYNIKDIPAMMNASMGFTMFMNLCTEGMLSYDFAFIREGRHPLLTAYGKLSLPVAGTVLRPGYAYMDNYTSDLNESNAILQDYVSFGKWFPGIGTDIGLYFNLLNGNRIGVSYRWDYLSTGHKGDYRFDNALHSVNLSFMFNVN